ncbi:MAG TPA: phosphate ABC transporter ATP-binding protein, partial [Anaerolineae bacterium]|nr:phosphate ABC transporter ATP-binding protein [Anaerolineae bacterium]
MTRTPKIEIENLSYSYEDGTESLAGVSLAIQANEITALFGPAGGGKSTLLRVLNRLNDLTIGSTMTGRVLLDGQDIYAPDFDVIQLRQRVGIVFAQPLPLPLSIRANVEYGPRLAGLRDSARLAQVVERSLQAAALWDEVKDRLDESGFALSGGQQQRLCLARVLALEPEVILLDEPMSGLDPISTAKIEDSLRQLKRSYTIVIVPHNIQQAARVSDRAAFFLQGRLIEAAPSKELFTKPRDKRTEDY